MARTETVSATSNGGRWEAIVGGVLDGDLLPALMPVAKAASRIGDSDEKLESALRKEYPRAELLAAGGGAERLKQWVEKILAHLGGREPSLDLPTDAQATAFQRRVGEELRRIPYGTTRTYSQIARRIGRPNAVRAVARTCAGNPVSVVVPCHRVVREDRKLAGYRRALERRQVLPMSPPRLPSRVKSRAGPSGAVTRRRSQSGARQASKKGTGLGLWGGTPEARPVCLLTNTSSSVVPLLPSRSRG